MIRTRPCVLTKWINKDTDVLFLTCAYGYPPLQYSRNLQNLFHPHLQKQAIQGLGFPGLDNNERFNVPQGKQQQQQQQ